MENNLNHNQLTDSNFIEQFKNGSLNPQIFNHEAHLRLAWLYIDKFGIKQAEKHIQKQLQNFVEIVGGKDKYHKTLTIVAIRIVNHFIRKSESDNFNDFIDEFPQLKSEFKELVNTHYSFNIFSSDKARTEFLKPDLLNFE
ncbi:hypothetical protein [Aquimarina sp. MMG016]|uniref:hypothetical protein n=1 Tax=Aquimarina sp. MMG016 TaxID=2822690 RepID=UPI001B3A39F7|nr:hypothetical protein [Aquimarina sp. MMG016]MBQ4820715.1 hypothetical protein [Aquimarina sp. MMG016]